MTRKQLRQLRVSIFLDARPETWQDATTPSDLTLLARLAQQRGVYSPCYGLRDVESMLWRHVQRLRLRHVENSAQTSKTAQ